MTGGRSSTTRTTEVLRTFRLSKGLSSAYFQNWDECVDNEPIEEKNEQLV